MPKKRIFLSYSHEDTSLKDEFLKHFAILERNEVATIWHDRKLLAGQRFEAEISEQIRQSDLFVFLISASFICSEFCWSKEMHQAIRLANAGNLKPVGIVVREVDFSGAPFADQMLLPTDAKAVTSSTWKNHDEAWTSVIKEIRRVCDSLNPNQDAPPSPKPPERPDSAKNGEKRIRVSIIQPELVRPEGLTELVGVIEVEFLGNYGDSEVCDLNLFASTNVTSQLLTDPVTEGRLEFEPQTQYPLDRNLRPRFGVMSGVNALQFRSLPIGEVRRRYGRAIARILGVRINANQVALGATVLGATVMVGLAVPQFGEQRVEQTELAYQSPPARVVMAWRSSLVLRHQSIRELVKMLRGSDTGLTALLFRVRFTTYFGRWELPGSSTRIALRLAGLTDYLQPVFATKLLSSSDPSLSARLIRTDSNGAGPSYQQTQNATLVDDSNHIFPGHVGESWNGCSMGVWEVQDAAMLAVQNIEIGFGLSVRNRPFIPDDVLDDAFEPTFAGSLAPLSTVTTASMSAPLPRFADLSTVERLILPAQMRQDSETRTSWKRGRPDLIV